MFYIKINYFLLLKNDNQTNINQKKNLIFKFSNSFRNCLNDFLNFKLNTSYIYRIQPLRVQLYEIKSYNDIITILNNFGFISIDEILDFIIEEYIAIYPKDDEFLRIKRLMNNSKIKTPIEEYAINTIWFAINYSIKIKKMQDILKKRFFLKLKFRNVVGSENNINKLDKYNFKINDKLSEQIENKNSDNRDIFVNFNLSSLSNKSDLNVGNQNNYCCFRIKKL
tara:strand:+ start:127 stop:798 length:672 start_codon:yes stop_codon:yes gene_type:complete